MLVPLLLPGSQVPSPCHPRSLNEPCPNLIANLAIWVGDGVAVCPSERSPLGEKTNLSWSLFGFVFCTYCSSTFHKPKLSHPLGNLNQFFSPGPYMPAKINSRICIHVWPAEDWFHSTCHKMAVSWLNWCHLQGLLGESVTFSGLLNLADCI